MSTDLYFLDSKTLIFVTNAIRESFKQTSLEAQRCLDKATVREGPKGGKRWVCKHCDARCLQRGFDLDHIEPVVPLHLSTADLSLEQYYKRCFTTEDNLQVLCKACHKVKCASEVKSRAHFRALRKPSVVAPKRRVA